MVICRLPYVLEFVVYVLCVRTCFTNQLVALEAEELHLDGAVLTTHVLASLRRLIA